MLKSANLPALSSLRRPRHDATIALGVIALCLATVLGLRLIAKDSPSAGRSVVVGLPTPVVNSAEGCTNFATFWMDKAGVGASVEMIEGITNCRLAADGTWIVPSGGRDVRLQQTPVLSSAQRSTTAPLRSQIVNQLDDLDETVPSTLRTWLSQIYDPFPRAVLGHLRDGASIRTTRNRYVRLTQAYLIDPANRELADYVGWVMARRITSYGEMKEICLTDPDVAYLRNACLGLEDNLSIRSIPFTWDLKNSYLLDSYLLAVATSDPSVTSRSGAPVSTPS